MRKWNRTVIEWDCFSGLATDIEVTDMPGEHEKLFHAIRSLRVVSLPKSNRVLVETAMYRCIIAPTSGRHSIIQRLKKLAGTPNELTILSGAGKYDSLFRVVYAIPSGQQLCDWAIDWVERFLKEFGVTENPEYRLAGFTITQHTFVFHDGKWVNFAWWLREVRYKLPQLKGVEEITLDLALMP